MTATTAQHQPRQYRQVIKPAHWMLAMWAVRAGQDQIKARCIGRWSEFGELFGTFKVPAPLQHQWIAVDHDIEKAADQQAKERRKGNEQGSVQWIIQTVCH